jgi:hypothetical protein
MKKWPSDATLTKAEDIFNKNKRILTGQGLSRKELRQMQRAGLVESQLMKHKDTGQAIYAWKPVSVSEGIIKKT